MGKNSGFGGRNRFKSHSYVTLEKSGYVNGVIIDGSCSMMPQVLSSSQGL